MVEVYIIKLAMIHFYNQRLDCAVFFLYATSRFYSQNTDIPPPVPNKEKRTNPNGGL
jgi:hypothetical protein